MKLMKLYNEATKNAKSHTKDLTHTALPILTAASVDISNLVEGDEKLNREWLRLTGEAQIAVMDMIAFIKKNT